MPAGDAVRGDHDHVDVLALDDLHDVARDVIPDFDAGGRLDTPSYKSRLTLGQMLLGGLSRLLKECAFGNEVWNRGGGKHRDYVHEIEFSMKVLGKVSRHLQGRLGRWAKVDGQQDLCGDRRNGMYFRHYSLPSG